LKKIDKKTPPTIVEIDTFLKEVAFNLSDGFIDFFKESNGADISGDEVYIIFWELNEVIELNKEYQVEQYAPGFFIFGSNGGGEAFAIEKNTGNIYEIPFIGMSKEEAIFKSKSFKEFIESI
jgi:SMI1 / KNR4 family (SUKH-1)